MALIQCLLFSNGISSLFAQIAHPCLNGHTVTKSFYSSIMSHVGRNKNNRFFVFYIGKKCVWVCVRLSGENTTHAAPYCCCVINGQAFFAEGCWLRDVLTKIWLAEPKAYFITHKTFHLLVLRFAERPSLSAECGWIPCLWTTLPLLHLLCWYSCWL